MARLLVVDDNPAMRRLLEYHLLEAGYEVDLAEEGGSAIKALLRRGYDLVVTDYQMPYLDGLGLAQAIKKDPKTSHLPIVVLTGYDGEDIIELTHGLRANYISKSVPMDDIVIYIGRILERETGMVAPRRS